MPEPGTYPELSTPWQELVGHRLPNDAGQIIIGCGHSAGLPDRSDPGENEEKVIWANAAIGDEKRQHHDDFGIGKNLLSTEISCGYY